MTAHQIAAVFALWLIVRVVAFAVLAAASAGLVSFIYRVRIREDFPEGAALLVGVGMVAIYLNTRVVFVQFLGEGGDVLTMDAAIENITIFAAAAVASFAGRSLGHRVAGSERFSWAAMQPSLSPLVRATGRFITVTLPEQIDDIEGYDPASDEAKEALAGGSFEFPRGLTVEQLESELSTRLTERYDVGYVDLDLTADGTVEYLAIGQRVAGLGKTLPPGMAAVAIRADPPFSASPGDTIEIWRGAEPEAVGVAELRASTNDFATIAGDRTICEEIDPTVSYRLMTLAADTQPDREFASLLRRSPETVSIVEVDAESALVDISVGGIDATVIGIQRDGDVQVPASDDRIQPADWLFLLGRPTRLRKLEGVTGVERLHADAASWEWSFAAEERTDGRNRGHG